MAKLFKVGMGTQPKEVDENDFEVDIEFGRSEIYPYWCCSGCNDYFAYFTTMDKAQEQWDKSAKVKAYCEPSADCHYGK